ncbi:hypothetical protein NY2A_b220L [Paramecium bursaria Chlorella virus NY2A]|uniref:Uncharacterized protein b220L n=1 Tax=Paramecium bursaria Chlorella virus NY2A TaxID=46021 RepID=A7IW95_PBCVN|nr:hypothetical protein NY2A_b220L [Paramecium bursaria Chlorella virus NY2A]ABT14619.1 hypothetical protein NY2A_b220L [Paramecium bursaria Chlorella virus NY2A]
MLRMVVVRSSFRRACRYRAHLYHFLNPCRDRDFRDESRVYYLYHEEPSRFLFCSSIIQDTTTETREHEEDVLHRLSFYTDIHSSNSVVRTFAHVLLCVQTPRTSRPSLCSYSIPRRDSCRDHRQSSILRRRDHRMSYMKIRSHVYEPIF